MNHALETSELMIISRALRGSCSNWQMHSFEGYSRDIAQFTERLLSMLGDLGSVSDVNLVWWDMPVISALVYSECETSPRESWNPVSKDKNLHDNCVLLRPLVTFIYSMKNRSENCHAYLKQAFSRAPKCIKLEEALWKIICFILLLTQLIFIKPVPCLQYQDGYWEHSTQHKVEKES